MTAGQRKSASQACSTIWHLYQRDPFLRREKADPQPGPPRRRQSRYTAYRKRDADPGRRAVFACAQHNITPGGDPTYIEFKKGLRRKTIWAVMAAAGELWRLQRWLLFPRIPGRDIPEIQLCNELSYSLCRSAGGQLEVDEIAQRLVIPHSQDKMFIRHSSHPNCDAQLAGLDAPVKRIAFEALRGLCGYSTMLGEVAVYRGRWSSCRTCRSRYSDATTAHRRRYSGYPMGYNEYSVVR